MSNTIKSIQINDLGNKYYNQGNLEKALSCYNQAISLDDKNSIAFLNRANLFADLSSNDSTFYPKAISDYNQAAILDPSDAGIIYNRAVTHQENNKLEEALRDFDRATKLNPNLDNAYYNMGIILYKVGQKTKNMDVGKAAIKHFLKAEELGNQAAINVLNKIR